MRHLLRRIIGAAAALALPAAVLVATTPLPAAAAPIGFTTTLVGDVSCQLARVDLTTGTLTPFGPASSDHCAKDLAFAEDGTLYGMSLGPTATGPEPTFSFMQLVRFDTSTGAVTVLGQITSFGFTFSTAAGLAFDTTGTLYAQFAADEPTCAEAFCLYRVDPANPGAATLVGSASQGEDTLSGLTGACGSGLLTQLFPPQDQIRASLAVENPLTAQVTIIGSIGPEDTLLFGYDFDTAGVLWGIGQTAAAGTLTVFTVDPATGAATASAVITGAPQGTASGLAIAPRSCPAAPPPGATTPPPPVVIGPTFTG